MLVWTAIIIFFTVNHIVAKVREPAMMPGTAIHAQSPDLFCTDAFIG
jgi:hypothetical protein